MNLKTWVHKNEIDRFVVGKEYRGIVFTGELITLTRCWVQGAGLCLAPHKTARLYQKIRKHKSLLRSVAPWLHAQLGR